VNYDALTLAALSEALRKKLLGGRVQRIVRPSSLSIGLEVYTQARHQLLLSAEPQGPTALLVEERLRRGTEKASPLLLLLRKYVEGARLRSIAQPELERVLHLRFEGAEGEVTLVCELMGRLSNLILIDASGIILDAAKRIPASINRRRTILPGHPYTPPPAQEKLHPLYAEEHDWLGDLLAAEGPLWRRLVETAFGISPLLAREAVYRASGQVEPPPPWSPALLSEVLHTVRDLLRLAKTGAWAPSVAYQGEGTSRHAVVYAPYALTHLGEFTPCETIEEALRLYLRDRAQPPDMTQDPYEAARRRLKEIIGAAEARLRARVDSLRRELPSLEDLDTLQWQAKAILALAWQIRPGQRELAVEPYALTGDPADADKPPVIIPLDPALAPAENAQALFREYRKKQAAAEEIPPRLAEAERELSYLQQLATDIDLAENRPQLEAVECALIEAGYGPRTATLTRRASASAGEPLRLTAPDGTPILIGRNSAQNAEVTFHRAKPDDVWLHAHGVPGAHVIIRCEGRAVAEETLILAAQWAVYYSANRSLPHVLVDYTLRRYVRPIPGGRPGMVLYREERTITVTPSPAPKEAERL